MSGSFKVKIFDAKGTHLLQVPKSAMTLGSASHCDVVVNHPSVAPEHTRVWLEGGRVWVQDLGAPAGSSVNDVRLPALKPMLVRELDILRLGGSEVSLGLEAQIVRAPHVQQVSIPRPPVAPRPPLPPSQVALERNESPARDLAVEKRQLEIAALSRELADLRLQLQFAKLDREAADEIVQQQTLLRDEIKLVQEQKTKWQESLRQLEAEKQDLRQHVKVELEQHKMQLTAKAMAERVDREVALKREREIMVTQLAKQFSQLSRQKVKSWTTRPLSQDMIFEWEAELVSQLRRHILGEESEGEATVVHVPLARPEIEVSARSEYPSHPGPDRPRTRLARRRLGRFSLTSWMMVFVAFAAAALFLGASRSGSHTAASVSGGVSEPHIERPSEAKPIPSAESHYEPTVGHAYLANYTDNVLFLQNYLAAEENASFHQRWAGELTKAAQQEWKLSPVTTSQVLAKEQLLIQDLSRLRQRLTVGHKEVQILEMRAREGQFIAEMNALLHDPSLVARFLKYKRNFFVRNESSLSSVH